MKLNIGKLNFSDLWINCKEQMMYLFLGVFVF